MTALRFSVVIPARDAEATVERAVASALAQNPAPVEIVVVDDGSSDRTAEVVSHLDVSCLRLLRQPRRGVSAARNRGVEAAEGDWIVFLDADDEALPGWLATFAEATDDTTGAVCAGAHSPAFGDEPPETRLPADGGPLFLHHHTLFLAGTFAVRRSLLESIGGYWEDLAHSENTELGIRIVHACRERGLEIRAVERPVISYHRRRRDAAERSATAQARVAAVHLLLDRHRDLFGRSPRSLEHHCAVGGVEAARIGRYTEARAFFARAARARPDSLRHRLRLAAVRLPGLRRLLWRP